MNIDQRFACLEEAARKRHGASGIEAQRGFTRVTMPVSLLKQAKVKKLVKPETIKMGNKTYHRPPEYQTVWCLNVGARHEWFYGNTMMECIQKAEKTYSRWLPKGYANWTVDAP